jgi:hypothetical protein
MTVTKFACAIVAVVGVAEATYRSGSVSSYEKFTYGKFVTRMKAPDKMGTVSSFFTYWDGPHFKASEWNELDIEIVPSVERNPFSMNIIYGDGHEKHESHQYSHGFNPRDDWHTYTMEWTPDYISWAIDGHEVRHVPADHPSVRNMNKEQSLRMNFWTPTFHSWGHGLDASDMPWYLLYDYVEVHKYNQANNEFELHWRDDFENFDDKRWHKASGGFDANSSIFHPENVSVKAGNLVLKMEPDNKAEEMTDSIEHVVAEHEVAAKHVPIVDHTRPAAIHRETFDREHARSKKSDDDKKFWLHGRPPVHAQAPEDEDKKTAAAEPKENEYMEDSSDSDADWQEYQTYIHHQSAPVHHVDYVVD